MPAVGPERFDLDERGFMRPDAYARLTHRTEAALGRVVASDAFQYGLAWDDPGVSLMVDVVYPDYRPADGRSEQAYRAAIKTLFWQTADEFARKDGNRPRDLLAGFREDSAQQAGVLVSRRDAQSGLIVPEAALIERFGLPGKPLHPVKQMSKTPWCIDEAKVAQVLVQKRMQAFHDHPERTVDVSFICVRPQARRNEAAPDPRILLSLFWGALAVVAEREQMMIATESDEEAFLMIGAMDKPVFDILHNIRPLGSDEDFGWQALTGDLWLPYDTVKENSNKSGVCAVILPEWRARIKESRPRNYALWFGNTLVSDRHVAVRGLRHGMPHSTLAKVGQ